ncbi:hypothetical protein [Telluribacter sp.]|uniref:hypothetical protein n=1 Tax=Telluribacter sp. TaxID=1978767 RepID=UPI002E0FCBAA|nr:hypothetical protein [Telluribacter sp.]
MTLRGRPRCGHRPAGLPGGQRLVLPEPNNPGSLKVGQIKSLLGTEPDYKVNKRQ